MLPLRNLVCLMLGRVPNAINLIHAPKYHIIGSVQLRGSILIPIHSREWPTVMSDRPKEYLVQVYQYVPTGVEQSLPVLHDSKCQDSIQNQVHQQPILVYSYAFGQCCLMDLLRGATIFNNNYTLIIVACMHLWICRESKETKSVYNSHEDQIERSMAAETQLMWKSDKLI